MYVRDHARPAFHNALGVDPTDYDYRVFRICSEITKQVFPFTLDTDNPRFRAKMERLRQLTEAINDCSAQGGVFAGLRKIGLGIQAAAAAIAIFLHPVIEHETPREVRMAPAW